MVRKVTNVCVAACGVPAPATVARQLSAAAVDLYLEDVRADAKSCSTILLVRSPHRTFRFPCFLRSGIAGPHGTLVDAQLALSSHNHAALSVDLARL